MEGSVVDVAVDIRNCSPTFGKHVAVELSAENRRQLFVPRGFAHGFIVLSDHATFSYKVDNFYSPECDRGILFNDLSIGIDWKMDTSNLNISEKDMKQPLLCEAKDLFDYKDDLYV